MSLDARRRKRRRARASMVRLAHARRASGARSARRLARGSTLAQRRRCRLGESRAGDATRKAGRGAVMSLDARRRTWRRARAPTVRLVHARRSQRRSVGAKTRSRIGARSATPASALREPSRRCDEESRTRLGDVTRRTAAHTAAHTCVDGTIGACTMRSAALGRHDSSPAARRSLGVAGAVSERAEPAMRRGEQDEAR